MEPKLMYVELKTGFNDNGPAWIGRALFSKTGKSIYFNGLALKQTLSGSTGGNKYEINTGDIYWVSGIKKNEQDRHWAGSGKIRIDTEVIPEYLKLVNRQSLPKNKFEIVELDNNPPKEAINEIENRKLPFENE
jgi:hypothetical protein